jgi:glycosyltransferase involved in cell wall biosynthesis
MSESSTSLSPLTDNHLEFTVLMPCLNESAALAICVHQALEAMRANGIRGEVLVADNGSTDGSQRIAAEQGAGIVPIEIRGQGNALRGGIAAARGKYILMGDADGRREGVSTNLWLQQIAGGPPHQPTHLPDDVIAYA